MKFKNLLAATAVLALSSNVLAQSALYDTGVGGYQGAMPVGIIVSDTLKSALQSAQLGAECAGEASTDCMPSISTIELASIAVTNGTQTWDQFGLPAFAAGAVGASNVVTVCGSPVIDDTSSSAAGATRVAMAEIGMGCSNGSFPADNFNPAMSGFTTQSEMAACTTTAVGFETNTVGFASLSDTMPSGFSFVKFNGSAPELVNLLNGDYSMFGDVHGAALAGMAPSGADVPRHKVNRTESSDICAPADQTNGADLSS
jgi:hypothetical protein